MKPCAVYAQSLKTPCLVRSFVALRAVKPGFDAHNVLTMRMSLTGPRSWHHLQPLVNLGVGVISAPGDKPDISGYKFGTQFSFSYGFGVRYATGRNSELRFDLNQYWWQLKYPPLYRSTQGDPVAIRATGSLDSYTANTALTIAWSLRIFR